MMIKAIDVSYHNGNIDFSKVKSAGINAVIIRAGYGSNTIDKQFKNNIIKASANGLAIGVYWFSYALNTNLARIEANTCIEALKPYKDMITLPIFFDWEYDSMNYAKKHKVNPNRSTITAMCKAFCEQIENAGYTAGVYFNEDYRKNYINIDELKQYKTWYARYTNDSSVAKNYNYWQYSSKGRVNGISGNVDLDYINEAINITAPKTDYEIAREVIAGKWGNGITRKTNLKKAGYDYSTIQKLVNSILRGY